MDDGLKQQLFESLSETISALEKFTEYFSKEKHDVEVAGVQPTIYQAKLVLQKARSSGLALAGENRRSLLWQLRFFLHDSKGVIFAIIAVLVALAMGMAWMLS